MTPQLYEAYTLLQQGQPQAALRILRSLAGQATNDANVAFLTGIAESLTGDKESAVLTYQALLRKFPTHTGALLNMGADLYSLSKYQEALEALDMAQSKEPSNPLIALNLGNVHKALNHPDVALKYYTQALALDREYSQAWSNRGDVLCQLGRISEAMSDYQEAIRLNSKNHQAIHNLGLTYIESKQFHEGLSLIRQAIALDPFFAVAYNSLGIGLMRTKEFEAAFAAYQRAIEMAPDLPDPYFNLAETYIELREFTKAIKYYELAVARCDKPLSRIGALLHTKMKICDWKDYTSLMNHLLAGLAIEDCVVSPFTILGLPSSAALQKRCAETFSAKLYPVDPQTRPWEFPVRQSSKNKIRIGYLSSDFYGHATAYLMAELFELHDRDRFEIVLFSYGAGPNDAMRSRIVNAVDAFHDVQALSDPQIAEKIRASEINILVDLKGHTQDARLGPLAHRPAPIQAHYLGYPGTLGAEFIDYLIADNYLIHDEDYDNYTEKIIHLPDSYQVNDRHRKISPETTTRSEHGLPQNAFVFCCFNNNWKITPEIFDVWMRLLRKNPTSVLWLLEDNPLAAENLMKEAHKRGIDSTRLIFAQKEPLPEHLARHQHADLFLDTPCYNAHTTASDALWAGLPVLTVRGSTFAGRVGGSLLSALNMPDMIATDLNVYETKAHEICINPELATTLRSRLKSVMATAPLFDTPKFARSLEAAYEKMMARWQQGLSPEHIRIGS